MGREDILKFTNSVIFLSKLFIAIEDRFLKQKFHGKISDFVSAFIEQKSVHALSVAQYRPTDLINSINNLIDFLEHLAHTSKNDITPLLSAQKNLLKFKLHILQQRKRDKMPKVSAHLAPDVASMPDVANSSPKPPTRKPRLKTNSNKEQIYNYVKKTPEVRAKDVLSEFSALSGRTVKRSLKELTDEGFLKKMSDGGAVYYLAATN